MNKQVTANRVEGYETTNANLRASFRAKNVTTNAQVAKKDVPKVDIRSENKRQKQPSLKLHQPKPGEKHHRPQLTDQEKAAAAARKADITSLKVKNRQLCSEMRMIELRLNARKIEVEKVSKNVDAARLGNIEMKKKLAKKDEDIALCQSTMVENLEEFQMRELNVMKTVYGDIVGDVGGNKAISSTSSAGEQRPTSTLADSIIPVDATVHKPNVLGFRSNTKNISNAAGKSGSAKRSVQRMTPPVERAELK